MTLAASPLASQKLAGGPIPSIVLLPTHSLTAVSADKSEGDTGAISFTFRVTRTNGTSSPSSVDWAVTGSGANPANASDFVGGVLPSGTVSFAATETTQDIIVSVQGDTTIETAESFQVTIANPSVGDIGTAAATGTIQNDDVDSGPSGVVAPPCAAVAMFARDIRACGESCTFIREDTDASITVSAVIRGFRPEDWNEHVQQGDRVARLTPLDFTDAGWLVGPIRGDRLKTVDGLFTLQHVDIVKEGPDIVVFIAQLRGTHIRPTLQ